MIFFNGFGLGILCASVVYVVIEAGLAIRLSRRRKEMAEFSRRADELIEAGENPTTWTSEEKREAWMAERAQWQKDVRVWEQKEK